MNTRGLTFESMPPFSVPLRFYLTAPLFGMAAGLVLLCALQAPWESRYAAPLLSGVHLSP